MSPFPPSARCARRSLLNIRSCTAHNLLPCPAAALATSQQRRHKADIVERTSGQYDSTPKFDSPFKNRDDNPTTKIPSFEKYMSKKPEASNKTFQYFMVGGMGLLAAAGAKATVQGKFQLIHTRNPRKEDSAEGWMRRETGAARHGGGVGSFKRMGLSRDAMDQIR